MLCPSIALVSQLRGEFLAHCAVGMNALAVCSDEGVAKDRDLASDPTADLGHASASEVKGLVTTKADEIGQWIDAVATEADRIGVIFGTYQSSHRIAEALGDGRQVQVLVADEAHRTAGLRRIAKLTERLRDFTVCHDDARFPAKYRIYQTATPRIYTGGPQKNDDWVVRDMADESVFGPELYRQSYGTAVANGWLTDYRIIAIGVNDEDAYRTANELAERHGSKLSTAHFLRGLVLALAMGGALRAKGVNIRSSINFMNLIARSREMTGALGSESVRDWVRRRLEAEGADAPPAAYRLEHLDAGSRVAEREHAKARLMGATDAGPARHPQCRHLRRGRGCPGAFRRRVPRGPQVARRGDPGRWAGDAAGRGQGDGLHHLPDPHSTRHRRRDVASEQRPGRRLEGTRTDIAGAQGP